MPTEIIIEKLGAAERQLNAAIRMVLANEDELAIHSVAAAAYGILRQIKQRVRRRSDAFDPILRGLFYVARDLAMGKMQTIPKEIADAPALVALVGAIRSQIDSGAIKTWSDVPEVKTLQEENAFWNKFNFPANFLKHGNKEEVLDQNKLDNHELLVRVAELFVEFTHRVTPEMEAYQVYTLGHDPKFSPLPESTRLAFAKLTAAQKRQRCLAWLHKEKRSRRSSPRNSR